MTTRFLADADLNKAIVNGVLRREPSVDFLSAHAAGLRGMKDDQVLKLAAESQRVLVSHDVVLRHVRIVQVTTSEEILIYSGYAQVVRCAPLSEIQRLWRVLCIYRVGEGRKLFGVLQQSDGYENLLFVVE